MNKRFFLLGTIPLFFTMATVAQNKDSITIKQHLLMERCMKTSDTSVKNWP
jgi:hypothetical protein